MQTQGLAGWAEVFDTVGRDDRSSISHEVSGGNDLLEVVPVIPGDVDLATERPVEFGVDLLSRQLLLPLTIPQRVQNFVSALP